MSTTTQPRMADQPGVRFGIANALLVTAFLSASLARLGSAETELGAILAAGLVSVGLPVTTTVWIGAISWALFTGFIENDYGQLTLAGDDLTRLVVFTVAALVLAVLTRRTYQAIKENAHA